MDNWLGEHPEIRSVRTVVADLNGLARGKRMPASSAAKVVSDGSRMPLSALNVDILGHDIEDSPLVFATGDADGVLRPTERGFLPVPWLSSEAALLPMWMYNDDGSIFDGDPRHALAAVIARYKNRGWTPVVATELEFYLVDDSEDTLQPAKSPRSGKRRVGGDVLSLRALDAFDDFFNDLYSGCEAMGIPADTAISEGGAGQFEINLNHCDDALRAADDSWFFKLLVKGLARKHGFAASFMAKPYPDHAGTGMHTHFSVLDDAGANIFDNGGPDGTDLMRSGIAGCLAAMPASMLIFAPHANSFERFEEGSHAPTGIGWGYENRTTAIRVPAGNHKARRIEHRVAGGDINPYLMLAAVLGAALVGMEDGLTAPVATKGNAYDAGLTQLPVTWADAINAFDGSEMMARILPPALMDYFVMTKRQELKYVQAQSPSDRIALYLDTV